MTPFISEKYIPGPNGDGDWYYLASPPTGFRTGGNSACWDGGDFIYVSNANVNYTPVSHFVRYSISGNSWEMLTFVKFHTFCMCE